MGCTAGHKIDVNLRVGLAEAWMTNDETTKCLKRQAVHISVTCFASTPSPRREEEEVRRLLSNAGRLPNKESLLML